jgi:hypothetical protein
VDTNTHRTTEKLNGAVLPIQSAAKLYKEGRLTTFPRKRLGKHIPRATAQYTRSQTTTAYTRSRVIGSVNRSPWKQLGKHVPGATPSNTRSRGNDSVNTFRWDRLGKQVPRATGLLRTDGIESLVVLPASDYPKRFRGYEYA